MLKIINGDALAKMKTMKSGRFRLVVTSPPYNITHGQTKGTPICIRGKMVSSRLEGWRHIKAKVKKGYDGFDDNMPQAKYVKWQKECLKEMWRLTADDGAIFYNHKCHIRNGVIHTPHELLADLPVRQVIIWDRQCGMNFHLTSYLSTYELIYFIPKPAFRFIRLETDIWRASPALSSRIGHPAVFPLIIPLRIIDNTAGDSPIEILDPFLGSGTTLMAAKMRGIKGVGIELSKDYCKLARERIDGVKHSPGLL